MRVQSRIVWRWPREKSAGNPCEDGRSYNREQTHRKVIQDSSNRRASRPSTFPTTSQQTFDESWKSKKDVGIGRLKRSTQTDAFDGQILLHNTGMSRLLFFGIGLSISTKHTRHELLYLRRLFIVFCLMAGPGPRAAGV